MGETEGFQCLGNSNWTICRKFSHFSPFLDFENAMPWRAPREFERAPQTGQTLMEARYSIRSTIPHQSIRAIFKAHFKIWSWFSIKFTLSRRQQEGIKTADWTTNLSSFFGIEIEEIGATFRRRPPPPHQLLMS